jgi:phosphoserine aminotransferase
MISFYPGPSRVHDEIPEYVKEAYKEGILSINHRSEAFTNISEKTILLLREKLGIPDDFTVFFTSSATECWEIIAQSLIKTKSYHLFNGAFGQKWFEYTKRLHPGAVANPFSINDHIKGEDLEVPEDCSVICITQNETSNGTQVSQATLKSIKKKYRHMLVAVDATSSMAGIVLNYKSADIWFASVQKCFGLPAGLGLMICSPDAMKQAVDIGERNHYNSVVFMAEMMAKWQTPFTPNVLGIYLLMRVLENSPSMEKVHEKVVDRYKEWISFLSERKSISHLIDTKAVRSYTVIPVKASSELIETIKRKAKLKGILLGEGYGEWKSSTFRIANFPAIRKKELRQLMRFLEKF